MTKYVNKPFHVFLYGVYKQLHKKVNGEVVPVHAMKAHGGIKVQLHSFLTWALDGGEWLTSLSGRFTSEKRTLNLQEN
jgi:hypothetical protein